MSFKEAVDTGRSLPCRVETRDDSKGGCDGAEPEEPDRGAVKKIVPPSDRDGSKNEGKQPEHNWKVDKCGVVVERGVPAGEQCRHATSRLAG